MNNIKQNRFTTIALLFLLLFAATKHIQAQTIYGPNSASIGRYYVDTVDVDIKYKWIVEGGYISDSIGIYDDTVVIHWTDTIRKIQVVQLPQFASNFLHVDALGATGNDTTRDDVAFQKGIDSLFNLGGGILLVDSGTYYIQTVLLKAGVKLQGVDSIYSILKRPLNIIHDTDYKYTKMLTTYTAPNNWTVNYSFLPQSNKNSRPIAIQNLLLDGSFYANPTDDTFENSSLIYLGAPDTLMGAIILNGVNVDSFRSGGAGKVKVFISDCAFKSIRSDAVNQHTNVDLHYSNCSGENIYRGLFTLTGGNSFARVKKLKTYGTNANQKGIDWEQTPGNAGFGFGNIPCKVWIDSSDIHKGAQFAYDTHSLFLTSTTIRPFGSFVFEGNMGDLIANNCNFSYLADTLAAANNYILGPSCGRYYDCNFIVFNSVGGDCKNYNGMKFRNYAGNYIPDSKLGFQNCSFGADPTSFNGNTFGKFGIYTQHQDSAHGQFFFKNCTNLNNSLDSILTYITPGFPTPACSSHVANPTFTNVAFKDSMLVCGETEDEMKSHFGYRIVGIDSVFKCNVALVIDTTVHKWDNPKV